MEYLGCVYKPCKHLLYFNINNTNPINRYVIFILHFYFHYFQSFFNNNIESTIKLLTCNGDRIFSFTLFHMIPCMYCFYLKQIATRKQCTSLGYYTNPPISYVHVYSNTCTYYA